VIRVSQSSGLETALATFNGFGFQLLSATVLMRFLERYFSASFYLTANSGHAAVEQHFQKRTSDPE
jgi:hypothetical protein